MRGARSIKRRLKARGISIIAAPQISFLGVDLASGKRHGRATRQERFVATLKQHNKVSRYAFASKRFRVLQKVEPAGPQAGARYGHQVHGLPATSLTHLRRRLGAVTGGHRRG
eukprot:3696395-Pyramimonas_sp.AAC.1